MSKILLSWFVFCLLKILCRCVLEAWQIHYSLQLKQMFCICPDAYVLRIRATLSEIIFFFFYFLEESRNWTVLSLYWVWRGVNNAEGGSGTGWEERKTGYRWGEGRGTSPGMRRDRITDKAEEWWCARGRGLDTGGGRSVFTHRRKVLYYTRWNTSLLVPFLKKNKFIG